MHSLRMWFVLLAFALGFAGIDPRAAAQSDKPAGANAQAASATASKAEVEQLRQELAAQRQTIEQLKNLVEQLAEVKSRAPAPSNDGAHLIHHNFPLPTTPNVVATESEAEAEPLPEPYQKPAEQKSSSGAPVTAGWNGEHFFIKSTDGQFQIQPYGYVQTDYRSYTGDGTPPATFAVRRGRFGFQGNYGDHYQFGLLIDAAAATGATIRDIYLNAKYNNALQLQAGQFKEPFAQELAQGVTNIDFLDRGLQSLLYPSAASAFRSPGVTIHGDIRGGAFQYWAGAFNGKGYNINNTTSVPETVGRVRFYPWRNNKDSALKGFAFGGAIAYSQSRGLSNELTAPMAMPDAAYTYLLTKETRPENGTPRVRHPVFGPITEGSGGRGWGAWEVGFRYSGIQGNEPGLFFNNIVTPQNLPTFNRHTDQFTVGVNWYLNYWVRFQSNIDINRLKDPSTIGAVPQTYLVFLQRLQYRF